MLSGICRAYVLASLVLLAPGARARADERTPGTWSWSRAPSPHGNRTPPATPDSGLRVNALAAASDGGVYVAGTAWGAIAIAPGLAFRDSSASKLRVEHAFLLKLSSSGRTVWAKNVGARATEAPAWAPPGGITALAVTADDTLVAGGAFTLTPGRTTSLAAVSPRGKVVWASDALGAQPPYSWESASRVRSLFVTDDGQGDIVVTGCDHSFGPFDRPQPMTKEYVAHVADWPDNGFVARLDRWGHQRWIYHFEPGGGRPDMFTCGYSVVPDGAGGLFVGASYLYEYEDSRAASAATNAGIPRRGSLVARLDANAKEVWSQTLGSEDRPVELAALPGGRVAVRGRFPRGAGHASGLAVLDAAGHRDWLIFDEHGRAPLGPLIAARNNEVIATVRGAPDAACSLVQAFGTAGHASWSSALPGSAYCQPEAISVGPATWVAGQFSTPEGTAAFVQRVGVPGISP